MMRGKSGQITVLVLLLSMLTLIGGLSIASRSLSDLKQVSYVDSGTKALAAAEVALQYAFANQANFGTLAVTNCTDNSGYQTISGLSLTGINNTSVAYKVCKATKKSALFTGVLKDDVVQVDLAGVSNVKAFDVSWKGKAAIEIEVVDKDVASGNYYLRRYGYNSLLQSYPNGFATGLVASNCLVSSRLGACNQTTMGGPYDSCTGYGEILYQYTLPSGGTATAQMIRIKPLYTTADVLVCAQNTTVPFDQGFDVPFYQVTATARATSDNSVKKIQADYYPAALPAIFDNVLYTGGNISK